MNKFTVTLSVAFGVFVILSFISELRMTPEQWKIAFFLVLLVFFSALVGIYSHIYLDSFLRGFISSLLFSPIATYLYATFQVHRGVRYNEDTNIIQSPSKYEMNKDDTSVPHNAHHHWSDDYDTNDTIAICSRCGDIHHGTGFVTCRNCGTPLE